MLSFEERIKMLNDVIDRLTIAKDYYYFGKLNRNDAIRKILDVRRKHADINVESKVEQLSGSKPLGQASNDELVNELIKQAQMLEIKLVEIQEDINNDLS